MYSSDFRKLALRILKQLNSYRRAAAVCKIRTRGHIQIYRSLHESAKQRTRSGHAIEGYKRTTPSPGGQSLEQHC